MKPAERRDVVVCEGRLGQLLWAWGDGNGGPIHQNQEHVGELGEKVGAGELNCGHV